MKHPYFFFCSLFSILALTFSFGELLAQNSKKEFDQEWKTNDLEKMGNALLKLARDNDMKAAELMMKSLNELAKPMLLLEAKIAELNGKTEGMDETPEKLKLVAESVKYSDELAGYDKVFDKAGEGISSFTDDKAIKYFTKEALKGKHINLKLAALTAVGKLDNPEALEILTKALKDKSPVIRQIVVMSLKEKTPKDAFDDILKLLEDPAWQVRSSVAETLGRYKDPRAIKPLIERLSKEKGRLAEDIDKALEALTGEAHEGNAKVWEIRFKTEGEKWLGGQKKTSDKPASLYDMTLRGTTMYYASKERKSDEEAPKNGKKAGGNLASIILVPDSERMIYILDISGSMNSDAPQTLVKAESTIGGADPNAKTTKVDVLKRKMISELPKLQPHQFFTIILYNHKVLWWQKELIPANKDNIKKAQDYINHIEATGSTNTYAALEAAFNMAGRGSFDKSYESSVDTIVLVSDGMPSTGQYYVKYKSNDKGELRKQTSLAFLDAVLQLNKLRRIRINTIGVPPEPMDDILGGLAADHGGTYYYWEIK